MENFYSEISGIPSKKYEEPKYLGIKSSTIKLYILALLVTITLSSSDAVFSGYKYIFSTDMYNHCILSASASVSILEGQIPPRTSETLLEGIGVPYHQFYSPLCHFIAGLLGLLFSDIMLGYALASILVMTLAFVYSYKLIEYITLSKVCAMAGAFIFVTGPYLWSDKVLRGAFAEYIGFCFLPIVLYYNLRAAYDRTIKYWILALISTSALALAHLITFFFFYLFFGVFILIYGIQIIAFKQSKNKAYFKNYIRKLLVLLSVAVASVLINMYYFYPVLFYDDLLIKQSLLTSSRFSESDILLPVLSLFSIFDMPFVSENSLKIGSRFQIGLTLVVSYIAYIYLLYNKTKSKFYWCFVITSSFILFIILNPFISKGPLAIFKIAQFSYRFLSDFQLIATMMGALALLQLFKNELLFNAILKKLFGLIIIITSLILVIPYLYPRHPFPEFPLKISSDEIYKKTELIYGLSAYLRIAPPPEDPGWISNDIPIAKSSGNSFKKTFTVDLEHYFTYYKGDEVYLNVLYYPGLQDINVKINNKDYSAGYETYWQKRIGYGDEETKMGDFHGLKITGLPKYGILEVTTEFSGSRLGNRVSVVAILGVCLYLLFRHFSLKRKRREIFKEKTGDLIKDNAAKVNT
jgi:hypothetical protein